MNRVITVKGTGNVKVPPDLIVIEMSLSAKDREYERTMELASGQLEDIRAVLKPLGFEAADIKTVSFNVSQEYASERDEKGNYFNRFVGYICSHRLKIEFDLDMDRLSSVLSAIAGCLASPEFSIRFTAKDKSSISNALLASAAANAAEKAKVLASAAGVSLGEIVSIDYSFGDLPLYSRTNYDIVDQCISNAPKMMGIAVAPDDIEVSDSVTMTWEIKSN
ncbi:MAG: SIMPL domain-containing protein [Oscillospiraceae bacterium]|nr:SIMPL domain-containing protein [Oscillospiraceae bacterium]